MLSLFRVFVIVIYLGFLRVLRGKIFSVSSNAPSPRAGGAEQSKELPMSKAKSFSLLLIAIFLAAVFIVNVSAYSEYVTTGLQPLPERVAKASLIVRGNVMAIKEGDPLHPDLEQIIVRFKIAKVIKGNLQAEFITVPIPVPTHGRFAELRDCWQVGKDVILFLEQPREIDDEMTCGYQGSSFDVPPKHKLDNLEKAVVNVLAESSTDKPGFTIRQAPKEVVLYTICRGPYEKVGPSIGKLYALAGQKGIIPRGSAYYVYLNNPQRVSSQHYLTEIRIPVGQDALKLTGSLG